MVRTRFEKITRALHFSDNSEAAPYGHADFDKCFKIRPLLDGLNESFAFAWKLGGHVSVDEGMIGFKGRSYLRQFMKNKRTRYGLKLFILACSNSGYAHTLKLEEGLRPGEASRVGYGGTVIKELVDQAKLEKGSTVYADNWFTGVQLAVDLKAKGIYLVGTTRKDRKTWPTEDLKLAVGAPKLNRGEMIVVTDAATGVTCMNWLDNKLVSMISTRYSFSKHVVAQRKDKKAKGGVSVPVPEIVDK
jgi:hypothetical protein